MRTTNVKNIKFLHLFVFLGCGLSLEAQVRHSLRGFDLKGAVKTLTTFSYDNDTAAENLKSKKISFFNRKGLLDSIYDYRGGKLKYKKFYIYENEKLSQYRTEQVESSFVISKVNFYYNDSGWLKREEYHHWNSFGEHSLTKYVRRYNLTGELIQFQKLDDKGKVKWYNEFNLDSVQYGIRNTRHVEYKEERINRNQFNQSGQLIDSKYVDGDLNIIREVFSYDSLLRKSSTKKFLNGSLEYSTFYKYSDSLTEHILVDSDSIEHLIYSCIKNHNLKIIRESFFVYPGVHPQGSTEFTKYDTIGNWWNKRLISTEHIRAPLLQYEKIPVAISKYKIRRFEFY